MKRKCQAVVEKTDQEKMSTVVRDNSQVMKNNI